MTTQSIDCTSDSSPANKNLVTSEQWDASWASMDAPLRLRPWRDYVSWRFAKLFRQYIKPGDRVLEVGCGGSRFLHTSPKIWEPKCGASTTRRPAWRVRGRR